MSDNEKNVEYVQIKKESLTLDRIALMAMVALLSWNVYTTNQLSITNAVLTAKLESISTQINSQTANYATRGDLLVVQSQLEASITRFENWLSRLGDRQVVLEESVTSLRQALESKNER